MQRLLLRFSFLLFLLTACVTVRGSHIVGMDLFYEHLTGSNYKVTLVVYADCGPNSRTAYNNLPGATPTVLLKNGNSTYTSLSLSPVGSVNGVEVTPVCAAEKSNTTCVNPNNAIPGITKFVYAANCTIPFASANWVFRFNGDLPNPTANNGQAGRSAIIGTISTGTVTALEARLNNTIRANSSPQFNTVPTPFYCINVPQQYNLGASDVDNDSLSFALVPGLTATNSTVNYIPPYSATNPLAAAAGTFSFSSSTGQTNFTPNTAMVMLVVQQVNEYANGVLIGTSMREMNFYVLGTCNNKPATGSIDTASNVNPVKTGQSGFIDGPTDFNLCANADSIRFDIVPSNPGNDTIYASVAGVPTGATVTISKDSTTKPIITFRWIKPNVPAGNYTFYVTYKDNGCPLSSTQTQAYTVHVYEPNEFTTRIAAPTQCVHKALVDYRFFKGMLPRDVYLSQNGSLIRSFRDSTGQVMDSLGVGTYNVTISSPKLGCASYYSLQIVDSGIYPYKPQTVTPVFYCKYATSLPLLANPDSGAAVHWYSPVGTPLAFAPTPRTDTTGIFFWTVDQKFKVCTSLRDTVQVYVTLRPIAAIDAPASICLNDTALINFTGTVGIGPILDYHWNFDSAGYVSGEGPGPYNVHWYDTGTKVIRLYVDENKCSSLPVSHTLYVKPIPYAGFNASDVCQYDTLRVSYSTIPAAAQQYAWDFDGADIPSATGPGPYIVRWNDSGAKQLTLAVTLDGCTDKRTRDIIVHPAPVASIANVPAKLCMGDRVLLMADGGVTYTWTQADSILILSRGPLYSFQILQPQALQVRVATEWGCADTASIAFNNVEPCCQLSYPDAFTPNNDTHNDQFRIVTYGNQLEYDLSVYNRWGQRVYHGHDPLTGWDGTYGGKACDAGVYFYYLAAKCVTGRQEEHKGEVVLIR